MGRIIKAGAISIDKDKKVFVDNFQKIEKPEEDLEPAEVAFTEDTFKALSPEKLAGSGERISTKNSPEKAGAPEKEVPAGSSDTQTSYLSPAAKKARHAAALEAIRIKELELEALEEELRNWEKELKDKEKTLTAKEQALSQELIQKRKDADNEISLILKTAKETAASFNAAAKAEGEAIKSAALAEVESTRDKAYKEGYNMGEEKGIAEGEKQGFHEAELDWQSLMKESEALVNELQTSRMGILKASEEEMLRLVIGFAKSVIKVEPMAQPEIILSNIDAALNRITDVDKIVMRINLRDKSMCQAHKDRFISQLGTVSELKIVEDATLAPGGIKIETGVGTIDASIETQCKELETALLNRFRKNQASK